MKTLLVARHAKSSWDNDNLSDFQRPLNKRGLRVAPSMGKYLAENDLLPDVILCSTAKRAEETGNLYVEHSDYQGELQFESEFYLAPASTYIERLALLPNEIEKAMVIGHNPGLEGLVSRLTGQGATMPTAAIAIIELQVDYWSNVNGDTRGELTQFLAPKDLGFE